MMYIFLILRLCLHLFFHFDFRTPSGLISTPTSSIDLSTPLAHVPSRPSSYWYITILRSVQSLLEYTVFL